MEWRHTEYTRQSESVMQRNNDIVRWQRPIFYRNLAISGYNRFFAFFTTLDHVVQESVGCNDYPRLAFSKFKMAAKMAAKSRFKL